MFEKNTDGKMGPVHFTSRPMNLNEWNHTTGKRRALVFFFENFRVYLLYSESTYLLADHSNFLYVFERKTLMVYLQCRRTSTSNMSSLFLTNLLLLIVQQVFSGHACLHSTAKDDSDECDPAILAPGEQHSP